MRTRIYALLAGAMVLGAAGVGIAGIDNSHHDMPWMGIGSKKCGYCHSVTGVNQADSQLGRVGNFCVTVCHVNGGPATGAVEPSSPGTYDVFTLGSGTAAVVGTVDYGTGSFTISGGSVAGLGTPILTAGHGMNKVTLNNNFTTEATAVGTTAWPYTNVDELQCTSCHAVHDATNPPFLNANLGGFCQRCHSDAVHTGVKGTPGNHPVGFKWDVANANANNRDLGFFGGAGLIRVLPTIVSSNFNVVGSHWNLGGHLVDPAAAAAGATSVVDDTSTTNDFTCVTCHAVHQNTASSSTIMDGLTVGDTLTTVCYGCHTVEPGRTGMGHPIDFEQVKSRTDGWTIPLDADLAAAIAAAPAIDVNNGTYPAGGAPMCVTCHDVHGAATGRFAIRVIGGKAAYATTDSVCDACHPASFANPTTADQHHPGRAVDYSQAANGTFPAQTAWYTQDGNGNLVDGLACQDCHVADGNATHNTTAHNW